MKELILKNHTLPAIVDDHNYDKLNKYTWYINGNGYANRFVKGLNTFRVKSVYLHKEILNNPSSEIDHIDRNKLNCLESNLRLCTRSENFQNRTKRLNTASIYKGVFKRKDSGIRIWRAAIKIKNTRTYLGCFEKETDAALAYNIAASKHFGEFAHLNVLPISVPQ